MPAIITYFDDDYDFGWAVLEDHYGVVHVIPTHDDKNHLHAQCPCEPVVDTEGAMVHNAFDGRVQYENGIRFYN